MMARAVAAGLAASLLLAGCSGDEEQPRTLPPAPSASPSPVVLPVPPEATPETAQGAAAFARYFFDVVVNSAYGTVDPRQIEVLSTTACNSCDNIVADIERLRDAGLRVYGKRFKLVFAEASPAESDGSIVVDFRFSSDPYLERDASGATVREEPAQIDQDAQVKLVRRNRAWAVEAIRTVDR